MSFASVELFKWVSVPDRNDFGSFDIKVMKDDEWKDAGSLDFLLFSEKKSIDLSPYIDGEVTKVMITKNGGGKGYIDAIKLGDKSPDVVYGMGKDALKKISDADKDVLDVTDIELIVQFNLANSGELFITGRIESTKISKKPFIFPESNNHGDIHAESEFFTYTLGEGTDDAFQIRYVLPGSGHPDGFIYFWVDNDPENLFVTMDFTPDNTLDGDADYARVHLKTKDEVQVYELREGKSEFGTASFIYTDMVDYQHKVYKFRIPLSKSDVNTGSVDLCFELYGTASDPTPRVYLLDVRDITHTSALGDGRVQFQQGIAEVYSYGLIWGTDPNNPNPSFDGIYDGFTSTPFNDNGGSNWETINFTDLISGLKPGTKYYIRAYAEWDHINNGARASEYAYSHEGFGSAYEVTTTIYTEVPMRNWGLVAGIGLIVLFTVIYFRRKI